MFSGMNQQEQEFFNKLQANEETMRQEILQLKQMLQQQVDAANAAGAGATGFGTGGKALGKGDGDWGKGWFWIESISNWWINLKAIRQNLKLNF